jgi:hypothetical protein
LAQAAKPSLVSPSQKKGFEKTKGSGKRKTPQKDILRLTHFLLQKMQLASVFKL